MKNYSGTFKEMAESVIKIANITNTPVKSIGVRVNYDEIQDMHRQLWEDNPKYISQFVPSTRGLRRYEPEHYEVPMMGIMFLVYINDDRMKDVKFVNEYPHW